MCALIPEFDARKDGNELKDKGPMKLGMAPGQSLSRSGAVTGASARNFLSTHAPRGRYARDIGTRCSAVNFFARVRSSAVPLAYCFVSSLSSHPPPGLRLPGCGAKWAWLERRSKLLQRMSCEPSASRAHAIAPGRSATPNAFRSNRRCSNSRARPRLLHLPRPTMHPEPRRLPGPARSRSSFG